MDGTQQECIVFYTVLGHGCLVEVIQKTHTVIILMNKHTTHYSAKQCSDYSHSCSAGTMSQQDTSYIIIMTTSESKHQQVLHCHFNF